MAKVIRTFLYCLIHLFINYFVAYIPCWIIRKAVYSAFGMKIGKRTRIDQRVYIFSPWRITVGDNTRINAFSILDGRGQLTIGSNVSVSMRAVIYTASHKSNSDRFEAYTRHTVLKDCSWIGVNAVILPGTIIENRVIVAANSVLKGETKDGHIYCGNPAVLFRRRELDRNYCLETRQFFL